MFNFNRTSIRPSLRKREEESKRYHLGRSEYTVAQIRYIAERLKNGRSPFPVYVGNTIGSRNEDGSYAVPFSPVYGTSIEVPTGPMGDIETFAVFINDVWVILPPSNLSASHGCKCTITNKEIPEINGKRVVTACSI